MKLAASIVGVGTSRVGQVPDRSALQLQADAAQAALNDAGLKMSDIDGLLTTQVRVEHWNMPCGVVANHLGVRPRYLSNVDVAGASGCAMIHQADRQQIMPAGGDTLVVGRARNLVKLTAVKIE